jgi:hypothetical protein
MNGVQPCMNQRETRFLYLNMFWSHVNLNAPSTKSHNMFEQQKIFSMVRFFPSHNKTISSSGRTYGTIKGFHHNNNTKRRDV